MKIKSFIILKFMKMCVTLTGEGVCNQKLKEHPLLKICQEFENLDTLITSVQKWTS